MKRERKVGPLETRIKAALKARPESLTAFVDRIDIARGTLYEAFNRETEEGDHRLDKATAELVAKGLGKTVTWVNYGTEETPAGPGADLGTDEARLWQVLRHLVEEDGEDARDVFEVLTTAEFDRKEKEPSSFDLYQFAKRRLRDARTKPAKRKS